MNDDDDDDDDDDDNDDDDDDDDDVDDDGNSDRDVDGDGDDDDDDDCFALNCHFLSFAGACERFSPCRNNGSCYDFSEESYSCSCPVDFTDKNCFTKISPCDSNPCRNGICTDIHRKEIPPSFVCRCDKGYYGKNCDHRGGKFFL